MGQSGWMEVAVGGAGDDAVTDGERTVAGGGDLVAADLAGGLEELVGEPVELAAHDVASVHDGMLPAGLVGGPPASEGLPVEVEIVVDDVEMPGCVEVVERGGDVARPQGVGGGAVVGIMDPVGDGELGGVGGVVLAEDAEHAAGFDGAVLGGVADEAQGGAGLGGEPAQPVEVAVGDGGGLVDDEHGAGVKGGGVGVVVGEVPGECLGGHAGGGAEGAGGFAFDGGADDPPAGGLPGVAGGGHGGGLAGTGPADGALDAMPAGAQGADEVALLVGELWLLSTSPRSSPVE